MLRRHVLSATADQKGRGAWRLSKPKGSRRHIDACIALAIAVFGAQLPGPGPSIYETEGIMFL